jgi:hypothetical protein
MWSKRLELLRDLAPRAVSVAILANPQDPAGPDMVDMVAAARALGMQLSFLTATGFRVVPCMDGARGAREKNLTSQRNVRVQPCIRPLSAAAVAAGPDVIH